MAESMFDPNIDPYDELVLLKHNVSELARGLAQVSEFMKQLARQHEQLTEAMHRQQIKLNLIETHLIANKTP